VDAPLFGRGHAGDLVVGFSASGEQYPAAVVPDIGVAIFAISVGSRAASGGSEAFVWLTGGEVVDKVGLKAKETIVALVSCPEGKGPPEGTAQGSE
jgi:hypothetical protein